MTVWTTWNERKEGAGELFFHSTGFKRHPFPATPRTPSSLSSSVKLGGGGGGGMFSIHWHPSFQGQKLFCRKKRIGLIDMHCETVSVVNRTTWATPPSTLNISKPHWTCSPNFFIFFFHLKAHNQHVDYSGAYNSAAVSQTTSRSRHSRSTAYPLSRQDSHWNYLPTQCHPAI